MSSHPLSGALTTVFAALLCAAPLVAGELLLNGAIVHTLTGPPRTNVPVLLRDDRIAAIGGTAPASARVIDLAGLQLFPGLIAPDTFLGLQEIDAVRATRDTTEVGEFTPDIYAWIAVNPDSELIPVARANGYTHVEVIPLGRTVAGHSAVLKLTGWTIEDLAVKRAAALHVIWPSFALDPTPKHLAAQPDKWKSIQDQIRERERRLQELDGFFSEAEAYAKARAASGTAASTPETAAGPHAPPVAGDPAFTIVPAWESLLPALRGEIPLVIHADETRQIRSAVEWAVRRKYRIALAGGRDAWRVAALLAQHRVPVAYEHVFTQPSRDTDPYDVQFAAAAVLHEAGVEVSFTEGTDRIGASASNLRNVPYAAAQAMAFGLPRLEAHRGLTLYPARLLGIADRLGTLEAGKEATLIAVEGDILDVRANVRRMWIAGVEVGLESRHTRLYERYRRRPHPTP